MNKTLLSTAIVAAFSMGAASTAQAINITWADNTAPLSAFPSDHTVPFGAANLSNSFGSFNEFRVLVPDGIDPGSTAGGGEKSIVGDSKISGAGKATALPHNFVSWDFSGGNLTGVNNTDATPGATYYAAGCGYVTGTCVNNSAATAGDIGLFKNAAFLGSPFGFLAPIAGSAAAAQYGVGTINFDSTDNFTINFPVLEAQWNSGYFTLGQAADPVVGTGINFDCTGATTGNVTCTANHQIQGAEDSLGFAGTVTQWELHGVLDTPHVADVPVPAAVWLFGSGLLGLVGVARRKRSA